MQSKILYSLISKSGSKSIRSTVPAGYYIYSKHNLNATFSGRYDFSTSTAVQNKTLVNGLNLHWEKFGNGPHVALCVPGYVGSIAQHFEPVSNKFNLDRITLIAWDPPGYGKSRPPDRKLSMKDMPPFSGDAVLAAALMKELGYDKYSLLGFSNGGITGALVAAAQPDAVEKLVMCNSVLNFDEHTVRLHAHNWTESQLKALLQDYDKIYAKRMLRDGLDMCKRWARNTAYFQSYAKALESIRAPTLYISSKNDSFVPKNDVVAYGKHIDNFKIEYVAKGGHSHLGFLNEFVTATENFLTT